MPIVPDPWWHGDVAAARAKVRSGCHRGDTSRATGLSELPQPRLFADAAQSQHTSDMPKALVTLLQSVISGDKWNR